MAVGEGAGHRLGVEPGVDQWLRVTSEVRMSLGFMVVRGRFVVNLISGSWVLATNLPEVELLPVFVLGAALGISILLLFFLAFITTPSSKVSSSPKLASEPRAMPVTVARSSAAAGPARRSAVATASFSSSRVILGLRGPVRGGPMVLRWLRAGPGPPKRKLTRCIPVDVWVWPWAPAARGSRLSSRAQSSAPAAGTMGLGGLGLEGGR